MTSVEVLHQVKFERSICNSGIRLQRAYVGATYLVIKSSLELQKTTTHTKNRTELDKTISSLNLYDSNALEGISPSINSKP